MQVKYQPPLPASRSVNPPERPAGTSSVSAQSQYPVKEPYPEARVVGPNLWYARLLQDAAFGAESEMTAINEYNYFAVMTDMKELRELYQAFARDEMRHLELFMEDIRLLCGDPRVMDGKGVWWCGNNVYYGYRDCDRLAKTYEDELAAAANYRRLAGIVGDPNLAALLERIAKDEDQHARLAAEWMKPTCGYYPGSYRPV